MATLAPSVLSRLRGAGVLGTLRSVRVRRVVAVLLVVAAVAVAVAAQRRPTSTPLIVAAADLRPGVVLSSADLSMRSLPSSAAPDGALTEYEEAVGRRLTGPVRRGEVLTEARLLTARLPESLTGVRGARLVPVRPADESVAQLVQQGDLVDVIDADRAVLARGAVVAVTPSTPTGRSVGSVAPPVLLAMEEAAAQRVAASGLGTALALILH